MKRKSMPMMVSGIVLTSAGVLGVLIGSAVVASAQNAVDVYCDGGFSGAYVCDQRDDEEQMAVGYGVMIGGAVAAAVGIPLWVIGAKKVPAADDPDKKQDKPSAMVPIVMVGPTSATLRWSF
jgi:hypothetical protein